jgi:hypothetical protein
VQEFKEKERWRAPAVFKEWSLFQCDTGKTRQNKRIRKTIPIKHINMKHTGYLQEIFADSA